MRLDFCYLKINRFLHPSYYLKIVGDNLKNIQKASTSVLMRLLMAMKMRLKIGDIYITQMDLGLDMDTYILNIKYRIYNDGYMY